MVAGANAERRDADVRWAARALSRHGLVHAYGHVSARVDDATFVVTPSDPLGRMTRTTSLVAVSIAGPFPHDALPEVCMHQAIYQVRPDVAGICRFQSPSVIALSAIGKTPRALHGLGAYFAPGAPLWGDPSLVRDPERASLVASMLGPARAIVLRGNGAVTVGASVREATCHAFFLEDAARVELSVLATGEDGIPYSADQAARRASGGASLYARMWDFLLGADALDDAALADARAHKVMP